MLPMVCQLGIGPNRNVRDHLLHALFHNPLYVVLGLLCDAVGQLDQHFVVHKPDQSVTGPHQLKQGQFGADMSVQLVNEGPTTFMLRS